ncbi:flagellar FliJ protein [Caldanaerovirga acetigignens]|uniref:Flagellar FliJ protein n=1 Tax=Caldanaerovirga acetigignens TaxID=447595 RepID=A0A1M7G3D0_9FIRM|nr:flagellar export protein FliJ [Caldanaerovirga acetigignens]SHM10568.1 flagellar FliJ protein [Caldanaerovirga acetigignens]
MKRFKFNLNTALRIKQKIEQIREHQLIEAHKVLEREKQELLALKEKKNDIKQVMEKKLQRSLKASELILYESSINALNERVKNQESKVNAAIMKSKEISRLYLAARRERQVIEKLKEKKYANYLIELNREEQKILDDIASLAYIRRGGEE